MGGTGGGGNVVAVGGARGAALLLLLLGLLSVGGGCAARVRHAVCFALTGTGSKEKVLGLAVVAADISNEVMRRVAIPDSNGVIVAGVLAFIGAAGGLGKTVFALGTRSAGTLANAAGSGHR